MNFQDLKNLQIVVNSSDACLRFASEELKDFMLKCVGANIDIVEKPLAKAIYVGCGKTFEKFDYSTDAFSVIFEDGNIYLLSQKPRGVLYAVYDFVEKFFGVRFLTVDYTYIPSICELQNNPVSYSSAPSFPVRQYLAKNVENDLFSARLRLYSENYRIREEYGKHLELNGKYGNNHSLLWLTKPAGFFEKGEERYNYARYQLNEKGKEHAHVYQFNKNGEAIDICMSDGITDDGEIDESMEVSAFKLVLSTLKDLILTTNDKYYPIGQMDHTDACQCEKCVRRAEKYTRAGLNVIFGNLLMRELRKWMKEEKIEREIYLVFFAYEYSTLAPVKRENGQAIPIVKADPNLCVRIAPIRANCYFPICSDMHFLPFERIISEWRTVCDKIMIWSYHTQYHCFLWYFPTMQQWYEDLNYYKSLNVEYMFMQSNHCESVDWKANMELYVASKMLWDTSRDPYQIRNEYIDLVFGNCSEYVKEIIDIFDKNYLEIAKRSEKMRRRIYKEVNGEYLSFSNDLSTEQICDKLQKEAIAEWTKNVYFSIYGPEIAWYELQPIELLEKQMKLLEHAKCQAFTSPDFERIVSELEKIELTLRFMILFNYKCYYGENGYVEYKNKFLELCKKTGFETIAEGKKLSDVKGDYKLNYFM